MLKLSDQEMLERLKTVPANISAEDGFFSDRRVIPGRASLSTGEVFQPHESSKGYEELLAQIKRVAPERYSTMHKGTPFYFIGWLAYEMRDYEKGVFYMDAALSEDAHNNPSGWMGAPAAAFLFLDDKHPNASAKGITIQARHEVDSHLRRFSSESGLSLDIDTLVNKFIKPYATDPAHRSIITSLLTFLLEGKDLQDQISLRSQYGGSLEPFLTHLFKGGLIFESLLKRKYGAAASGNTLGPYLNVAKAKTDLSLSTRPLYKRMSTPIKFEGLPALLQSWTGEPFHERAIAIAYAVRNTTGHDLGWQDVFTEDIYRELFDGIVDAIFWVIKKAYNA
jgi:hypothetical protein